MKTSELREKQIDDLEKELVSLRKEQFSLRMLQGSGQAVRPHLYGQAKKNIARVKTVIAEKQAQKQADQTKMSNDS